MLAKGKMATGRLGKGGEDEKKKLMGDELGLR